MLARLCAAAALLLCAAPAAGSRVVVAHGARPAGLRALDPSGDELTSPNQETFRVPDTPFLPYYRLDGEESDTLAPRVPRRDALPRREHNLTSEEDVLSDAATVDSDDNRSASTFERPPNCIVDILLTANDEQHRIRASRYRMGEVFALTKTMTDGSTASYYVGCRVGLGGREGRFGLTPITYLRVEKRCRVKGCLGLLGRKWHSEDVRQFWFDTSRRAIAVEDKGKVAQVELNPEFLVPSFPGRDLATDVTFKTTRLYTCEDMPPDTCYVGCCGAGLACAKSGKCVPRKLPWLNACRSDGIHCKQLIEAWEDVERWALMVTSSGGGGHIAAARNLVAKWSKEWRRRFAKYKERFQARGVGLLRRLAHKDMKLALQHAEERGPPIIQVDIMDTPCFDILGVNMGGFARRQWDDAQAAGDLEKLKELIDSQWLTPWVFGHQCKNYFEKVLKGKIFPFDGSPSEVISTQPLLLHSISNAMQAVDKTFPNDFRLDVYMTDLPTEASVHFFAQLKKGVMWNPEASQYISLHSVPPVDPDPRGKLASLSGLPEDQIVIEDFMPVATEFTEGVGMPRPGEEAKLALKAQTPQEQTFLSGLTREEVGLGETATVTVGAADRLLLVMLGSQPTVKAMRKYLDTALHVPEASGLNWVFLACGKPSVQQYAELYKESADLAAEFNDRARDAGRSLRIVPFTGQPAQHILSRADATLTRSGGLTSGELLALAHRGDKKDVLLHVEVPDGVSAVPPAAGEEANPLGGDALEKEWTSAVLEGGMVGWEAGNARHLMAAIHARIVTSAMDFSKLLSF